jgi:DNA-directed RNA polymerase subunit K/omega
VIRPPADVGVFHFAVVASLRATQLIRGCRPRLDGDHKPTVMAQYEVAAGQILAVPPQAVSDGATSAPELRAVDRRETDDAGRSPDEPR